MKALLLITAVAAVGLTLASEEVVLKTHLGNIRGVRVDTDQMYYYSFRGIQYAEPPVGSLRFKDPVEAQPYEDEFDAMDDGLVCPQFELATTKPVGDENCLNLNVYTPKLDKKKRAVIVYLHGGMFQMGGSASSTFGPDYLVANDVVIVAVNSRIGPFGFLATEDKAATGNMGIKDQIVALKWIKKNIANFGGDPDNVTLMGDDSGAASVSIHTLSPLSTGLFHKAILLSGNAMCDHMVNRNPQAAAEELATSLDCSSKKGEDIVGCLGRLTQQEIIEKTSALQTFFSFPRQFVAIVDGDVLPDEPEKLLASGNFNKVPVISGQNKDDGAFFYRLTLNVFADAADGYDDNFLDHKLPRILPYFTRYNSKLYPITRQVRKRYFMNVDMDNEDEFMPKYNELLTDILNTRCTAKFNNLRSEQGATTYAYSFDYRGQYSIVNLQGETADMGVAHGDQMQYIFAGLWGKDLTMSTADLKFSRNVWTPVLTNFAKTSEPVTSLTDSLTTKWTPLVSGQNNVLRIGSQLQMENDWKKSATKFWHEDIPKLFQKKGGKITTKTAGAKKDEL